MKTALELHNEGYRVVSRKHRILSRVDISDAEMIKFFIKQNYGSKDSGVPMLSLESQRDFYRRVYSKDTLTLAESDKHLIEEMKRLDRITI